MKNFYFLEKDGIEYFTPKIMENERVFVAFTTRNKGVSKDCYDSLNLAFHTGDERENVIKNRLKLIEAFGFKESFLTCAEQVHSSRCVFVSEEQAGSGGFDHRESLKNTDGLITNLKNVPLTLFFADCVPVVMVDKHNFVAGIAHAGWKGTYEEISKKMLVEITGEYNSAFSEISVFIGPSIGSCCYEVDESLSDAFKRKFKGVGLKNKRNLDLAEINKYQLIELGVLEENILSLDICTSCNSDLFFSHRRDKKTGRQAGIVALL
ncbi:MAG: peptidoglycan editing factor PgeF [Actinobacteria bacterium]|nr:peptidoglycan editing factor PgeF [Actinomycetota bacterium]